MGLLETLRRRLDRDRLHLVEASRCRCDRRRDRGRPRSGIWTRRRARSKAPCASLASTAICLAAFANGTPRALPDRLPSALSVMRSFGLAGATVISPSGEEILACASSHPASMVSASGTATAKRPAALKHAKTFGEARARTAAILRHPGQRQAGIGQRLPERGFPCAVLVAIDGLGVGEIGEDLLRGLGNDVLTLRHGVPHLDSIWHSPAGCFRRGLRCGLFLRFMMRKSHSPDKRCPQGCLRAERRHERSSGEE